MIVYSGLVKHLWVYPILEKLPWIPRIGFIAGAGAGMLVLYFIGEGLHRLFWPDRRRRIFYSYRYMTRAGRGRCSHVDDSKNGSMGSLSLSNCSNGCHQYGSLGFCLRSSAAQYNPQQNQARRNSVRFGGATDEDVPFSKNGQATSPSLFTLRSGIIVGNDKSMMAF